LLLVVAGVVLQIQQSIKVVVVVALEVFVQEHLLQ
jgi:hypothetical protein